jgi:hypothetical protein
MTSGAERHRRAALRHEQAADTHDRSATFWDGRGKPDQAGLQRELASHERTGADLERRWGDLVNPSPAKSRRERRRVREQPHPQQRGTSLVGAEPHGRSTREDSGDRRRAFGNAGASRPERRCGAGAPIGRTGSRVRTACPRAIRGMAQARYARAALRRRRQAPPTISLSPVSTGRDVSRIHSLQEPTYRAPRTPPSSSASTSWAALTPEPQ